MKKVLIVVVAFMIVAFTDTVSVSAINVGSQFREVTVGEVDGIDDDENIVDEKQEVHAPETGLFGLDSNRAFVVVGVLLSIPVVVSFVWLFGHIHHRHTKKDKKQDYKN